MSEKEYREIQLSPSQLTLLLLGLIGLGVIIFLLGISVGKKQTQIKQLSTQVVQQNEKTGLFPEEVFQPQKTPTQEKEDAIKQELTFFKEKGDLYYVQVGAFNKRESAESVASKFIKKGYPTIVLEPFATDKIPLFRVRIGGFSSHEEAAKIKVKLESSEKAKYIIIKP
ncbi:MAG: SPOR domain-containing protein [Candidatus Aminicenantia bacterium]